MIVYDMENRMGRIPKETMNSEFQDIVVRIQATNTRLQELRHKKKKERTENEVLEIQELEEVLKNLREKKQECLQVYTERLASKVNSLQFRFQLNKVTLGNKIGFRINNSDHSQLFAMKQLQYNLQKTFKVKQANRHFIMASIKLLLKTKRPYYIIRTDVSSFFESIPQERLLHSVMDNTLLSYKSKVFVKAILEQYEEEKKNLTNEECMGMRKGCGVPRGIGISSLLSEVYMRDLDSTIRKRPEVIFYVRYVDDIFMLLAQLPNGKKIEDYYHELEKEFQKYDLTLKASGNEKCSLVDCSGQKKCNSQLTYLGYRITINSEANNGNIKNIEATFRMSAEKYERLSRRIDNAFKHFNAVNQHDLHQARKDLVDSLKLITGNVRLHKSKSGIKTGLYFNSDLLDEYKKDLQKLNNELNVQSNSLETKLNSGSEKERYVKALQKRIQKFDFVKSWETRKMYSLSGKRLQYIMRWLNYETKEDKTTI